MNQPEPAKKPHPKIDLDKLYEDMDERLMDAFCAVAKRPIGNQAKPAGAAPAPAKPGTPPPQA